MHCLPPRGGETQQGVWDGVLSEITSMVWVVGIVSAGKVRRECVCMCACVCKCV